MAILVNLKQIMRVIDFNSTTVELYLVIKLFEKVTKLVFYWPQVSYISNETSYPTMELILH